MLCQTKHFFNLVILRSYLTGTFHHCLNVAHVFKVYICRINLYQLLKILQIKKIGIFGRDGRTNRVFEEKFSTYIAVYMIDYESEAIQGIVMEDTM